MTWQGTPDLRWTADIVQRVRAGDVDAFGQIVKGYERRVFALAIATLRNREGAEDVTQDAFVRAFERLDRYDLRRPFYPWLATITIRLSHNWRARHSPAARRETPIQPESSAYASAAPAALDVLVADNEGRHLWGHVERLPLGERTAVVLHYRQELSVSEVASAIGVTAGTVKTLLFRARQHLRASLAGATPWRSGVHDDVSGDLRMHLDRRAARMLAGGSQRDRQSREPVFPMPFGVADR